MGELSELWRYPLKSAQGEQLSCVRVEPDGLSRDRAWACVDPADGTVGSAKHPRRWGRLLEVRARVDDRQTGSTSAEVSIDVGGRQAAAGSSAADALLSEHLGRPIQLTQVVPERAFLHRQLPDQPGMVPDWMATSAGQETVTSMTGAPGGRRFVDFGAVHLLTTGALAEMARRLGRHQVDAARFRPNLVIDSVREPEVGQELRIGDVALRVILPTPRCIVPGLDLGRDDPIDQSLLTALARDYRTDVGAFGRAACFGYYAEVLRPGVIEVGQTVRAAA